jgi:hypothetical protein
MIIRALIENENGIDAMIDGPEKIINNLKEYLLKFDNFKHPKTWGSEEFVDFLNDIILKNNDERVIIVRVWKGAEADNLPILKI